jgi:hypothetical protein
MSLTPLPPPLSDTDNTPRASSPPPAARRHPLRGLLPELLLSGSRSLHTSAASHTPTGDGGSAEEPLLAPPPPSAGSATPLALFTSLDAGDVGPPSSQSVSSISPTTAWHRFSMSRWLAGADTRVLAVAVGCTSRPRSPASVTAAHGCMAALARWWSLLLSSSLSLSWSHLQARARDITCQRISHTHSPNNGVHKLGHCTRVSSRVALTLSTTEARPGPSRITSDYVTITRVKREAMLPRLPVFRCALR